MLFIVHRFKNLNFFFFLLPKNIIKRARVVNDLLYQLITFWRCVKKRTTHFPDLVRYKNNIIDRQPLKNLQFIHTQNKSSFLNLRFAFYRIIGMFIL